MAQPSPFGDDQDRLLDEASAVVKEQAFYLKRAIDSDSTREALKHASNMICELRTSLLSPKNYYELYMQVFQEMQHLHGYFCDPGRHGRKMVDLYESVQHAGNILPRLYLLATVGSAYIKSKEAPAKEILKDVGELCKGVQHPLRGLFLRYYVSQMMKDKVPDVGSGYEGEGGDMDDAFDAIFSNFMESNRLWVRIQSQGPLRDKSKREKERHDLRVLVGANLVRLSQLDGMSLEYYTNQALPKILDHIISVKDTMSQQYFFESMIQVFGDEFHLNTLEQLLTAYAKAQPTVDMKPIVVALMTRLANYLTESEGGKDMLAGTDVFSLFRTHLNHILERALTPAATGGGAPAAPASPDLGPCLEIQAAFMSFTNSLYPGKVHYVDLILGSTVDMLRRHAVGGDLGGSAQRVADLLACPIKTLSMAVLEMEHYPLLLDFLDFSMRKQVALSFVNGITEDNHPLTNLDAVNSLFKFITPLITDMRDTPGNYYASDPENFVHEQQCVAKLAHQIRCEDMDSCLQMVTAMRGFFGQGGPQRMTHTLPAAFHAAMSLIPRLRALDARRAEGEEDLPVPAVTPKKVFQFMHKTVSAFQTHAPEVAIQLWLVAAGAANIADSGSPGVFDQICYEFLTQAIMCFEEELSETVKQFAAVHTIVGTLTQITCLNQENYDAVSEKITLHAAKLLKKPMQCRAVAACSHLYWCSSRRDGRRVLECLQKCLKVTDAHVQSDASSVGLWVEMLDKYVYYCDHDVEEVQITFIQSLLNLCQEHISYAEKDPSSAEDAKKAKAHWNQTVACLRDLKASPESSAKFAGLDLP